MKLTLHFAIQAPVITKIGLVKSLICPRADRKLNTDHVYSALTMCSLCACVFIHLHTVLLDYLLNRSPEQMVTNMAILS